MALENVDTFHTWCIKYTRKTKSDPEKKNERPSFLIPGAQMALEIFGLFWPLVPLVENLQSRKHWFKE